jgi:hypothetical protein
MPLRVAWFREGTLSDDYKLIYDVTQASPPFGFPAVGLVFIAMALLSWFFAGRLPFGWINARRSRRARKILLGFVLGFSILWTTLTTVSILGGYYSARRTLESGKAGFVEGPVEEFQPMPLNGHGLERFRVGNVRFAHSDYVLIPGYNQTGSHGGAIRGGLMVRIHYGGQPSRATILKLETRE